MLTYLNSSVEQVCKNYSCTLVTSKLERLASFVDCEKFRFNWYISEAIMWLIYTASTYFRTNVTTFRYRNGYKLCLDILNWLWMNSRISKLA
ncbi:hypothetical protein PUN28_011629 [Cardiocondyla obscurior]|uniref:Uncharacterized protein n=1 Tax=Cardiocondyla obscurior TaxID=286306 RepID=A0AAW2FKL7_9HYME